MSKVDIVVVHPDEDSGSEIRARLERAGYLTSGPYSDIAEANGSGARLAVVRAPLAVPGVPSVLLVPEEFELPDGCHPEAIVTEPFRGKELENAVALAVQRLDAASDRALVQAVRHYALYMLDPQGTVVSWNPGGTAVHGYTTDEVIGQNFSMFYPEEDRKTGVPAHELQVAAAEGYADDTRWLLRKGGEKFWAEGLSTAIKSRAGAVIGYAKVTRDATERRQLEQKLERSNDELQRFAYTVSHDLQEPLRTVRSYAELVSRRYAGKMDSDADEFIQFMVDAAGRMTQLLKDLLAYSQAGRPDRTTPEPTQAANILQWAIMNVDKLAKETSATITYDPLPMVEADPTQLSQVFQNLLGNSIKYRSAEAPKIHISARKLDGQYEFAFTDNGIGVDPEHHDRIFGVFKRLHGKDVPGTGIGLAICRKIIESHGGRIWIESEAGKGSTFKFTLPAHE
ncbi:MAG TPA: ATP-binding protein [Bryobacteraceae bacterium]|nr:ATP-binding protein [Bryobacteraceae bacterium]